MKFVALLPVRDEADIIDQCLHHLLTWADSIYVFDTGSVDDTWEIVQALAQHQPRIKPIKKQPVFFSETRLRGYMFHLARPVLTSGDWFARVDADEFHHILPPEFLRSSLRKHETCVYHQYYDFQLTQDEADSWRRGEETLADRKRPISERRLYYIPSVYSEPRLCRYRRTMQWPETTSFPANAGFVAEQRIPIRHYPHRDPIQMQRRYRLRAVMLSDEINRQHWAHPDLHHWAKHDWRQFIVPNEHPDLRYWTPGTDLPLVHYAGHLRPWHLRLVQRFLHAACLPLLDRLRPRFTDGSQPQPIPPNIQARLQEELQGLP